MEPTAIRFHSYTSTAPIPIPSALSLRRKPAVVSLPKPPIEANNRGGFRLCAASASSPVIAASRGTEIELENRKYELLRIIQDTQRGLAATADQRSSIEEALVSVETFDAGQGLDLGRLDGTWRLQYTSAPDVLVLFESAARLPVFQVGQVFQKFECQAGSNGGFVRNVVKWSIPGLFEEEEGVTLVVTARFSCVSSRNIFLQFEEISFQDVNISEELQALIAPAILPRSMLNFEILQFFRTFKAQVPLRSSNRQSVGGLYYLSFLDNNMLLGRAVGGGGVFIFTRTQPILL
ncbi:PREDICTED: probable plastid-lipid-associated protein 10, chloroplastic [Ipomoea nil]|uniref:probable plastid-lipid-associated protein 10, chloroplastic n=1 Tax=Ipomoea nil TaxID=35883 RepID=UPI0009017154|nr:PREDICTED: probable plastid-lipid-associated protein 10, chloroplastic [Ipomoea nil]